MHELYVLARRVLLDAVEALGSHLDSMVLVGADHGATAGRPYQPGVMRAIVAGFDSRGGMPRV